MTRKMEPSKEQRAKVKNMVAVGISLEDAASVIGCTRKTLSKHFHAEIRIAKIKANASVSGMLYKRAMEGEMSAIIWWEKTRQKRKEVTVQETVEKPLNDGEREARINELIARRGN